MPNFFPAGLQEGFRNTTKGTLFLRCGDIVAKRTEPKRSCSKMWDNLLSHDKGKTFLRQFYTCRRTRIHNHRREPALMMTLSVSDTLKVTLL